MRAGGSNGIGEGALAGRLLGWGSLGSIPAGKRDWNDLCNPQGSFFVVFREGCKALRDGACVLAGFEDYGEGFSSPCWPCETILCSASALCTRTNCAHR